MLSEEEENKMLRIGRLFSLGDVKTLKAEGYPAELAEKARKESERGLLGFVVKMRTAEAAKDPTPPPEENPFTKLRGMPELRVIDDVIAADEEVWERQRPQMEREYKKAKDAYARLQKSVEAIMPAKKWPKGEGRETYIRSYNGNVVGLGVAIILDEFRKREAEAESPNPYLFRHLMDELSLPRIYGAARRELHRQEEQLRQPRLMGLQVVNLDETVTTDDGEEINKWEAQADPRIDPDLVDDRVFWGGKRRELELSLTGQEKAVYELWLEGYKGKEIADKLRISEPRVSQLKRQIEKRAEKLL